MSLDYIALRNIESPADDPIICVICLEKMKEGAGHKVSAAVSHLFHADCLMPWLNKHPFCPTCKTAMDTKMLEKVITASFTWKERGIRHLKYAACTIVPQIMTGLCLGTLGSWVREALVGQEGGFAAGSIATLSALSAVWFRTFCYDYRGIAPESSSHLLAAITSGCAIWIGTRQSIANIAWTIAGATGSACVGLITTAFAPRYTQVTIFGGAAAVVAAGGTIAFDPTFEGCHRAMTAGMAAVASIFGAYVLSVVILS